MTYQAPELLLVGAAQNLVLGTRERKFGFYNLDSPSGPGYEEVPIESLSW